MLRSVLTIAVSVLWLLLSFFSLIGFDVTLTPALRAPARALFACNGALRTAQVETIGGGWVAFLIDCLSGYPRSCA